jgi:competence protein ComEC
MLAAALGQLAPALALPLDLMDAPLLGYVGWVAHAAAGMPHASIPLALGVPALVATYAGLALATALLRRAAPI